MKELNKQGLLVAGPTSGKTFLKRELERRGVTLTDTDDVIERMMPEYFKHRIYNGSGILVDFASKARDLVVASELRLKNPKLVLTNLWSAPFMKQLFDHPEGVKPGYIYVMRANALEMTELSRQRSGATLSTGLTSKWAVAAEKWSPAVFDHVVWLPKDVFLSDVVTLSNNLWKLTEFGHFLSKHDRTFALNYEHKRGGSNENI